MAVMVMKIMMKMKNNVVMFNMNKMLMMDMRINNMARFLHPGMYTCWHCASGSLAVSRCRYDHLLLLLRWLLLPLWLRFTVTLRQLTTASLLLLSSAAAVAAATVASTSSRTYTQ